MPFTFLLNKVSPLGDFDEKYGQRYWTEARDEKLPVSFNSMNPNIKVGDTIEAEEKAIKLTKKNTEYYGLRKVKVIGESQTPTPSQPQTKPLNDDSFTALMTALKRVEEKVDRLLGLDSASDPEMAHADAEAKRDADRINKPPVTDEYGDGSEWLGEEI